MRRPRSPATCHPEKPHRARGLCNSCYKRFLVGRTGAEKCDVEGCDSNRMVKGMCSAHYQRARLGIPMDAPRRAPRGSYRGIYNGYVRLPTTGSMTPRYEHRVVMERTLGRELHPFETVHHRNGDRADNRPENLELWASRQPYGQRVDDLIDFVVEHYSDRVIARLVESVMREIPAAGNWEQ